MIVRFAATCAAALILAVASPASAAEEAAAAFTPEQEEAIRDLVRDYLIDHPEVIMEAIDALRERQRLAEAERARAALASNAEQIYDDPDSYVAGNLDGDVTIVEFFDYRCGYCKRVFPDLKQTIAADGNIRFVMKEFPILGPASQFASRAALASRAQGLYMEFHVAMMEARGDLTEAAVLAIAEAVGLDTERLLEDMNDPAIDAIIARNYRLADELGINGTPAFIIADQLVPGAISAEVMQDLIAEARGES